MDDKINVPKNAESVAVPEKHYNARLVNAYNIRQKVHKVQHFDGLYYSFQNHTVVLLYSKDTNLSRTFWIVQTAFTGAVSVVFFVSPKISER